jgi:deazaflavin-dependent oxidoreductase (nitroreductase family)
MSSPDFREALKTASELKLTVVGRKTGKKHTIPIWFATSGQKLYLLPVNGTANEWYKNLVQNPTLELQVSGKKLTVAAHLTKDKKMVEDALNKFRAKYGSGDVKRYYPGQDVAVELTL